MNKHFKFVLAGAAIVAGLAGAVSCQDLKGELEDLSSKVSALEKKVNDLDAQIKAGAVITAVNPVSDGVEVVLSNGNKFTLTNGKDGAPGADGKGSTVEIGANGNWFIDGKDTGLAAQGPQGPTGPQGPQGEPGQGGTAADAVYYVPNIETGNFDKVTVKADGTTVKEDSGIPFATGGGITAVYDKAAGTLTFMGVKDADGNPTTYTIGTSGDLKSFAIIPEVMHDGTPVVDFYGILGYPADAATLAKSIADPSNAQIRPFGPSFPLIRYRVNPTNASVDNFEMEFINRNVEIRSAYDDENNLIGILGGYNDGGELYLIAYPYWFIDEDAAEPVYAQDLYHYGWIEDDHYYGSSYPWTLDAITYRGYDNNHEDDPGYWRISYTGSNSVDMIALKATDGAAEIVSDYAQMDYGYLDRFFIIHSNQYVARGNETVYFPYVPDTNTDFNWTYDGSALYPSAVYADEWNRNVPSGIMTEVVGNVKNALSTEAAAVVPVAATDYGTGLVDYYDLVFRFDTEMNIVDSLKTYTPIAKRSMEELGLSVTYKFAFPEKFIGADGITNQQKFVDANLAAQGIFKLNSEFLPENGRAAVGRTPVVKVQAYAYGGEMLLAEAWVKVRIVNDETEKRLEPFEYEVKEAEFEYEDFDAFSDDPDDYGKKSRLTISWEEMNQNVLNKIETALHKTPGISFDEFKRQYYSYTSLEYPKWGDKGYEYFLNVNDSRFGDIPNGIMYSKTFEYNYGTDTELVGMFFNDQFDIENQKTVTNKVTLRIPSRDTYTAPDILITFKYTVKHDHTWPKINPDYYVGQDESGRDIVQVKGRIDAGTLVFKSDNREHFYNYMKNAAGAIMDPAKNHDKDRELWFELAPQKEQVNPLDRVEQSGQPDYDATNNFKNQYIHLVKPLVGDHLDYVVNIFDQMNNNPFVLYNAQSDSYSIKTVPATGDEYVSICKKQYVVRFKNIFKLVLQSATLVDRIQADTVDLAGRVDADARKPYYLSIIDEDKTVIWENNAVTSKAEDKYGPVKVTVAYNIIIDSTFHDAVNDQDMLYLSTDKPSLLIWQNLGTRLVNDKKAAWYPYVTIGNGTDEDWVEFNTLKDKKGNDIVTDKADVIVKAVK